MLLPKNFSNTIADTFYDKCVEILEVTDNIDAEGSVTKNAVGAGSFMGNVRFNALGALQEELGLAETIDVAVTCDTTVDLAVGGLMQYADRRYQVRHALPFDSHLLIVGKLWSA